MISTVKTLYLSVAILWAVTCPAQRTLFSANFEDRRIDSAWQVISGDWHIDDVQEMRIAPAEDGYQYVLRCSQTGYIRLRIGIPDSVKATRLRVQFGYYTFAKGPGAIVEGEFQKKGWKDGLRGKLWKASLPVKPRQWSYFQKDLLIPKEGNEIWLTFSPAPMPAASQASKLLCLDAITLTALP